MRLDLVNLSEASEEDLDDLVNVITGFTTGNLDKKTFRDELVRLQWKIMQRYLDKLRDGCVYVWEEK